MEPLRHILTRTNSEFLIGAIVFSLSSIVSIRFAKQSTRKCNDEALKGKICTMSAPGKALIAGGYLVLDSSVGVTIACSSRFYATVTCIPSNIVHPDCVDIVIESPQFRSQFIFKLSISDFSLALISDSGNEFIEKCLYMFFAFAQVHFGPTRFRQILRVIQSAGQFGIKLQADNDFYSQIETLRSQGKPLLSSSLRTLPKFVPCPLNSTTGKAVVVKTGMGSSAALTTALIAALLQFFGITQLPSTSISAIKANADISSRNTEVLDRILLHNLAQLAHAVAQGKLGSGFDVSAAVYGSQLYRRFSPEPFAACMEPSVRPCTLYQAVRDPTGALWTQQVVPLRLPPLLQLIMGDVCGGSSSTSMAREVLRWREAQPVQARELWGRLMNTNSLVAQSLLSLVAKLEIAGSEDLAEVTRRVETPVGLDWTRIEDNFESGGELVKNLADKIIAELVTIRRLLKTARGGLKLMGTYAGVGIEPDEQTALADATEAIPGVLSAGVPGAGGVDAIYALVLSPLARVKVEELWSTWGEKTGTKTYVCPLLLSADSADFPPGTRAEPGVAW